MMTTIVGHRRGDATRRPHTLAPTVVLGVTDEMKIAHEEIFRPILPIFGRGRAFTLRRRACVAEQNLETLRLLH